MSNLSRPTANFFHHAPLYAFQCYCIVYHLYLPPFEIFQGSFCSTGLFCDYAGGSDVCGSPSYNWDLSVPVSGTIFHNSNVINISVSTTLNQSPMDESYGIDNVSIYIR